MIAGVAILVGSRLRRRDARTDWLIATGGAFLVGEVVFSSPGHLPPLLVSLLAPFTAALVGGGIGQFLRATARRWGSRRRGGDRRRVELVVSTTLGRARLGVGR